MDILHAIRSRTMPPGGTFEQLDQAAAEIERLRALNSEILEARQSALDELFRLKQEQDDPIDWIKQNKKMIAAWQARGLLTPAEAENFLRKIEPPSGEE